MALEAGLWYNLNRNIVVLASGGTLQGPTLTTSSRQGNYTLSRKGIPMPLPKDPQKREEYIRKQRERQNNPEVKRIQSEKAKARLADPEVRKAMSERGKTRFADPEARKVASERLKSLFADPEWKRKNLEARIEAQRQPESMARRSAAAKKLYEDPEYRQKHSKSHTEAMRRPEVRAKMSEIKKAESSTPEKRAQLRQQALDEMVSPEARERSRQAAIKQNAQPGAREKHSAFMKEYFARPEAEILKQKARESLEALRQQPGYWESVAEGMAASKKYSRTNIERAVEIVLQALSVEYIPQKHIGRWVVDFFIPGKNLCLECDGDYWHSLPSAQDRDARKDAFLQQKGYTVLRILGSQILTGNLDNLVNLLT